MSPRLSYALSRPPWPALWPALAAGALLGLKSQLYYLGWDGWGGAWARLPLGLLAGALAGGLLAWAGGRLAARPPETAAGARRAALALLGLAPFIWLNYETLAVLPWLWLLPLGLGLLMLAPAPTLWAAGWALAGLTPAVLLLWEALEAGPPFWLVITVALGALYFWALGRRLALEAEEERPAWPWAGLALGAILFLGLALRLAGLDHAWPHYIPHVDAPKQLILLPAFLRGELVPPINYLVSHVYLYAALQGLCKWLGGAGQSLHAWALGQEGWLAYVLAARALQALLGALLPLLGFLTARRLWGAWAGLLAAFLLATDTLQMTYSRQLMGDVPQVLWVWVSFFFAVRILQEGRWWDYLLAGLAAGAAVAAKIYGGYVIVLALAAWGLRRPWPGLAPLGTLAAGMILGCLLLSPLFWLDPARWWHDLWLVVAKANPAKHSMTSPALGLWYALKALLRRMGWAWVALSCAGVVFVGLRHRRGDLLALLAALLSLAIVGVRLSYLREWDLVNLTPFLSLCLTALAAALITWMRHPRWRGAALVLLALFLVGQGVGALSDAWLARLPDTGQMARRWVAKVLGPDELMAGHYPVSKGRWLTQDNYQRSHKWDLRAELAQKGSPRCSGLGALVLERFWWDHPLPQEWLHPVQRFKSRNFYWENPDIGIYLPQVPDYRSQLILPHVRLTLPGPAYLYTPWARSRPRDLLVGGRFSGRLAAKQGQKIISGQPLGRLGFVALGRGRARLFSAPEIATPLDLAWDRVASGSLRPLRRLIPLRPRAYELRARAHNEGAFLWVGLYAQPETALPTLMRLGAWQGMARIGRELGPEAPPEAGLMAAAALVEAGQKEQANELLARALKERPAFLRDYRALSTAPSQEAFDQIMCHLSTASRPLLYWERLAWPDGPPGWPAPKIEQDEQGMRLTLAQPFLPGRVRLSLELAQPLAEAGELRVLASGWDYEEQLAKLPLGAGAQGAELALSVGRGPVFLTLELKAAQGRLAKLLVEPDLRGEFAWRWQMLSSRLAELPAWPKD